jgi:hypothetical protein
LDEIPPPEPADTSDPPPANWLRGAGLLAFTAVVAADTWDGKLDADVWALLLGLGLILYGPSVLIRSVFRR